MTLAVGADATLDIRLPWPACARAITSPSPPVSIEVARHQPSSMVTEEQIRALPEIGRNFLVLAQLLPGSGPLNASVTRFATTKFGGVADQRSGFTTLIDGGDVDDAQWGSPTINLTQESVQEFKVFRYQFDAQYGQALERRRLGRDSVRRQSNRGKRLLFRPGRCAQRAQRVCAEKPPFDEQRLGATIGGPLARNRTHLFGTYESRRTSTRCGSSRIRATSRFVT